MIKSPDRKLPIIELYCMQYFAAVSVVYFQDIHLRGSHNLMSFPIRAFRKPFETDLESLTVTTKTHLDNNAVAFNGNHGREVPMERCLQHEFTCWSTTYRLMGECYQLCTR